MRAVMIGVVVVAACGEKPEPVPPKRPNNELLIGEFERRTGGTTAIRFRADGSVTVAHDKAKLDGETLATGSFQIEKDQLTLTYDKGMCAGAGAGVYQVVVSKVGIHFKKLNDGCEQRAKIDGETWWRIR